jgi:hypothetical protein
MGFLAWIESAILDLLTEIRVRGRIMSEIQDRFFGIPDKFKYPQVLLRG